MHKKEITIGYLSFFLIGLAANMLFAMLPDVRASFGLSYSQAGNIMIALQIGVITSLLLRIKILDRLGVKRVLILATGLWLTGHAFITLTTTTYFLYAGVLFTGMSYGLYQNILSAYVNMMSKVNKNKRMSLMNAFFGLGSVGAPLAARAALATGNWKSGYLFITVAVIAMGIFVTTIPFKSMKEESADRGERFPFGPSFFLLALFILAYPLAEFTAGSWSSEYWKALGDNELINYSLITAFFWLPFTIGRFFTGQIADRVGTMRFMQGTSLFYLAAAILWLFFRGPYMTILALILMALGLAGMFPIFIILSGEFFPRHIGTITTWIFFFIALGAMSSQKLVGLVADQLGIGILPYAYLIAALMILAIVFGLSREHRRARHD